MQPEGKYRVLKYPSDGIFFNYKHKDIDWNSLDEKQKDEYFYEFVAHYLPSGFIEALGSPRSQIMVR